MPDKNAWIKFDFLKTVIKAFEIIAINVLNQRQKA